ncbi:MAG: lysophospholipid acyltransferase family protein [Saprospiraceae bacterium]
MNLYDIIRPPATVGLTVYFRKIYFTGSENIPQDKPVLFAVNHPTAFLDPCLMACFQNRKLHFLARGDFFINRVATAVLHSLNIIPIFRLKDGGFSNIKQNYATFARCFEYLGQGDTIMILAEGGTKHEKRLRPLKKGTARIAFGTLEKYPDLDLQIVPVGVNYTYAERYRSEVMIQCGKPIAAQDYLKIYQENPNRGVRKLLVELKQRMAANMVIIEKEEDEWLAEQLFQLKRHEQADPFFPLVKDNPMPLQREQSVCKWINQATGNEKIAKQKAVKNYQTELAKAHVSDFGLQHTSEDLTSKTLLLIIGFIPFLMGYLANFFPLRLGKWIGDKTAPHITFYSSITAVSGMLAWIFYFITLLIISSLANTPLDLYLAIGIAFLLPFLGYFALYYQHTFRHWQAIRRAKKLSPACQATLLQLRPTPVL